MGPDNRGVLTLNYTTGCQLFLFINMFKILAQFCDIMLYYQSKNMVLDFYIIIANYYIESNTSVSLTTCGKMATISITSVTIFYKLQLVIETF